MNELAVRLKSGMVILDDGCWEWQGCCGSHGYGQMTYKRKGMVTHRAAYEVFCGPIPAGVMVLHKCDYRRCINPSHLFLGTAQDNTNDMIAKGRDDLQNSLKLSDDQVRQIRVMCNNDISQSHIASLFNVAQPTISRVNTKQSYWWVE